MPRAAQDSHGQDSSDATITPYPDLLNTLIWNAIMERATDVHVHCVEEGVRVLHRVDGTIQPRLLLSPAEGRRLLNQLKSVRPDCHAVFRASGRPACLAG